VPGGGPAVGAGGGQEGVVRGRGAGVLGRGRGRSHPEPLLETRRGVQQRGGRGGRLRHRAALLARNRRRNARAPRVGHAHRLRAIVAVLVDVLLGAGEAAGVVLLVAGEVLVLDELADVGQSERLLARAAGQDVLELLGIS